MLVSIQKSDIILARENCRVGNKNKSHLSRAHIHFLPIQTFSQKSEIRHFGNSPTRGQSVFAAPSHTRSIFSLALHLGRSFLPLSTLCIPLQTSLLRLVLPAPLHAVLPRNGHVGWGDRRRRNHQQRNHKRRRIGRVGCWNTRRNKFQIYSLNIWSIYPN